MTQIIAFQKNLDVGTKVKIPMVHPDTCFRLEADIEVVAQHGKMDDLDKVATGEDWYSLEVKVLKWYNPSHLDLPITGKNGPEGMPEPVHKLKTWPNYFRAILAGDKQFEIRNNADRGFQKGDIILLREFDPDSAEATCIGKLPGYEYGYTKRAIYAEITYVTNFQQQEGYVVFGFKPLVVLDDCNAD